MRIAALFGVKDEVELVRASIDHLNAIGVDLVIAFDAGSTDGTREVLDAFEARHVFQVINGGLLSAAERRERQLALAREAKADWVFFVDADEFWIRASGSLKDSDGLAGAVVTRDMPAHSIARGPAGNTPNGRGGQSRAE